MLFAQQESLLDDFHGVVAKLCGTVAKLSIISFAGYSASISSKILSRPGFQPTNYVKCTELYHTNLPKLSAPYFVYKRMVPKVSVAHHTQYLKMNYKRKSKCIHSIRRDTQLYHWIFLFGTYSTNMATPVWINYPEQKKQISFEWSDMINNKITKN